MKRWMLAALAALVFGVAAPVSAVTPAANAPYISNFEIDYHLGRDDEKRSTLEVTERITAEFPVNKNKGIVREIPREYQGHSLSLDLKSVTRNGETEPIYAERNQGDFRVIETGTDDYINGTQVFEFKYTMRDVTRYFESTQSDEFYWDTNGTGWRSRIDALSVNLTMDEELRSALSGDTACYQGVYGTSDRCDIVQTKDGFIVSASRLATRENVTIALGFAPGTFAEYERTLLEKLFFMWIVLVIVTAVVGVVVLIWIIVRAYRWKYRDSELGTIVPEYIPPKDASVAASSAVSPGYHATMAAELTDLAVRHYIQILETRAKSFWRPAQYDIKVVKDISSLRQEEQEILRDMFNKTPKPGDRMALKTLQNNTAAYTRFSDNDKKLRDLLRNQYELKHIDEQRRGWFGGMAKFLIIASIVTLSPMLLAAGITALVYSKTLWVLSDKGLALRRYLKGLEMYIKVAERDRLKMLQSPEGAEKVDIAEPTDPAQLVKLYERVLPYAVLFGQEKEWSKRLGDYYTETGSTPDWYTGRTAFNAAVFSSMMTNFSSSVATTSASSSSSGGSGGGGFSGGGGGGGGGGFR